MRLVEVIERPAGDIAEFADGRLSDHLWLDLMNPPNPGFLAVRVSDGARTTAYAQISTAATGAEMEAIGDVTAEWRDAAETALDHFASNGGGSLTWWVDDADEETTRLAARFGLDANRALHEMRRPLPHEQRATVTTRSFRPGTADEQAWLAVNNRAFSGHPEQGGWTEATLATRLAAEWFDPDGFRLYEIDGMLAGFCWTKIHPATDTDPELGEIYVIAVDPAFHGEGLGRQLTLAGLDWLTGRGIATASLYVDAANVAAVALYERLGFGIHRTRTAYTGHVERAARLR